MSATKSAHESGKVFDTVAADYDRHRPTYPDGLVDRACNDLAAGDPVLEVGCGTGQLTLSLVARGLQGRSRSGRRPPAPPPERGARDGRAVQRSVPGGVLGFGVPLGRP